MDDTNLVRIPLTMWKVVDLTIPDEIEGMPRDGDQALFCITLASSASAFSFTTSWCVTHALVKALMVKFPDVVDASQLIGKTWKAPAIMDKYAQSALQWLVDPESMFT